MSCNPNDRSKRADLPQKSHRRKHRKSRPGSRGGSGAREGQELWLYGHHAVSAALTNPSRKCQDLLVTPDAATRLAKTLDLLEPQRMPALQEVSAADIDAVLPGGAVHQGVALKASRLDQAHIDEACAVREDERNVVVVLDHVTDPQNVGAVLRSAAAFGARALVLTQSHAPSETGSLAKAASGALDTVPYVQISNLARALDQLAELGYWRVGMASQAETTLPESDLSGNVALVLGAEGSGLRRLTAAKCDHLARLPTNPDFPDLNVSNAAAVALYEITRNVA